MLAALGCLSSVLATGAALGRLSQLFRPVWDRPSFAFCNELLGQASSRRAARWTRLTRASFLRWRSPWFLRVTRTLRARTTGRGAVSLPRPFLRTCSRFFAWTLPQVMPLLPSNFESTLRASSGYARRAAVRSLGMSHDEVDSDMRDAHALLVGKGAEVEHVYWSRLHDRLSSFEVAIGAKSPALTSSRGAVAKKWANSHPPRAGSTSCARTIRTLAFSAAANSSASLAALSPTKVL